MALDYSTKLEEFLSLHGSMRMALQGGVLEIFSGSAPATADAAETGTKLVTVSLSGGTVTSEVLAQGSVDITGGASGSIDSITVGKSGETAIELMSAAVDFNTSIAQTALDVADNININISNPNYFAYVDTAADDSKILIEVLPTTGTTQNAFVVTSSTTTLTTTDVNISTEVAGVAQANGLTYGGAPLGVLTKTGTWSGTVLATGVAGYFRLKGSIVDAGAADTSPFTFIRLQGTCGTGTGDLPLSTTSLTLGDPFSINTWTLSL